MSHGEFNLLFFGELSGSLQLDPRLGADGAAGGGLFGPAVLAEAAVLAGLHLGGVLEVLDALGLAGGAEGGLADGEGALAEGGQGGLALLEADAAKVHDQARGGGAVLDEGGERAVAAVER